MLADAIQAMYPLHYAVWENDMAELEKLLAEEKKHDIELLDPRKRTPLMLAVVLGHSECVKLLLSHRCSTTTETDGWTVSQEAVASGNFDILRMIISFRDLHRQKSRSIQVPELLEKLKNSPDFYVEMKWEFSSWIPLMSRVCPSDTYKVYKRGSNVRFDTTLIAFDNTNWQRGNRSYLFKVNDEEAQFIEIDHETKEFSVEVMKDIDVGLFENGIPASKDAIQLRLQTPIISNNIDIDKISFERNKSGWFAWKNEKNESINGYDCRVYNASNVEFITRTRSEHLSEMANKNKSRSPLHHFLGMTDQDPEQSEPSSPRDNLSPIVESEEAACSVEQRLPSPPPTLEEYFSEMELNGRDIGKPKKTSTKVQRFKATLWLGDDFPIKLQEQILPILDLMSTMASPHVSKLKDFITMQLPSGFPIKVEIPLFHVLNAVITFENVFALDTPIKFVSNIRETDDERLSCVIDDECFEIPAGYTNRGDFTRPGIGFDDDDELLEYAIRKSLTESGGTENEEMDIWEALKCQRPLTPNTYSHNGYPVDEETQQLQRALQESLMLSSFGGASRTSPTQELAEGEDFDENLELALRLSRAEKLKENDLLMEETRMIEMAIKKSLEER